jgi:hypothetical protein
LTIEHEFTSSTNLALSFVGNKGTRLLSQLSPINVINPSYLSMGSQLNDVFQPNQTELDGVQQPFPNFANVLTGCAPSVAQALRPFPQYCNLIFARNENQGNSTYNSLQIKGEHRLSRGLWILVSYTKAKLLTDADANENSGEQGIVSPFQPNRRKALALEDVPETLNTAFNYQLPFGKGKQFLTTKSMASEVFGDWSVNGIFRGQSGIPFALTSSTCNIPAQIGASCLPALLPGAQPFTHSLKGLNVATQPYLNIASFQPATTFNYFTGSGPRVQSFRQPSYKDFDIGLQKNTQIIGRLSFQLRGDAFNLFNNHYFSTVGVSNSSGYSNGTGGSAFSTDVASPSFGLWNGTVTQQRNLQVSGRFIF